MNLSEHLRRIRIIKELLTYPDQDYLNKLNNIVNEVSEDQLLTKYIRDYVNNIRNYDIYELQQLYVSTFDMSSKTNLYITYHLYGDDKRRGRALATLLMVYHRYNYRVSTDELPDNLLVILDFMVSKGVGEELKPLIKITIKAVKRICKNLHGNNNPYYPLFDALHYILSLILSEYG